MGAGEGGWWPGRAGRRGRMRRRRRRSGCAARRRGRWWRAGRGRGAGGRRRPRGLPRTSDRRKGMASAGWWVCVRAEWRRSRCFCRGWAGRLAGDFRRRRIRRAGRRTGTCPRWGRRGRSGRRIRRVRGGWRVTRRRSSSAPGRSLVSRRDLARARKSVGASLSSRSLRSKRNSCRGAEGGGVGLVGCGGFLQAVESGVEVGLRRHGVGVSAPLVEQRGQVVGADGEDDAVHLDAVGGLVALGGGWS